MIQRQGGERLRYFLLRTHYRSTGVFGEEEVADAGKGLDDFLRLFDRYQRVTGNSFYDKEKVPVTGRRKDGEFDPGSDDFLKEVHARRAAFLASMDDDFNTGAAVSQLFELLPVLNKFVDSNQLEDDGQGKARTRRTLPAGCTGAS